MLLAVLNSLTNRLTASQTLVFPGMYIVTKVVPFTEGSALTSCLTNSSIFFFNFNLLF